jgi:DNA repair photolyase
MEHTRQVRKGRGAVSNPAGRFEHRRVAPPEDADACAPESEDGAVQEPAPLRTIVTSETSRTIITRNDSPDVPFDRSVNPYKGCEHGCVYCFARPTHAYLGLSPGLDFETRIFSKPDAPRLLQEELGRPAYRCEPIALGANTDPYQPVERRLEITRRILEVLLEHLHPVTIVTKSQLVLRDLDLLRTLAEKRLACVLVSVTTLDGTLARRMEPRAATPGRRLETIRSLAESGVPAGVLASPMILGLNDSELERILEACAAAGARSAGYVLLRLPLEIKDLFSEWLEAHYPLKASRILHLVRETREGKLYDSAFGTRMRGTGPQADLLRSRFQIACRRLGLDRRPAPLDVTQFRVPPRRGDQLGLFPAG